MSDSALALHPGVIALVLLVASGGLAAWANDSARVRRLFADPPREYSTAPFWVWNDDLSDDDVVTGLRAFAERGIRQVFVHPRPGLVTPYLSDEWFRLWQVALTEAQRLDMNLWIYDENSYPSGFAGGHVPEELPESRGQGLVVREADAPPPADAPLVALFRHVGPRCENLTAAWRAGETLPPGPYLAFLVERPGPNPWYGGRWYVDLIRPGVTERFLALTIAPYQQRFGTEFGRRIPGSFTDEPQLLAAGQLPWTDDLPQQFEARWGYRLTDELPALERPVGDWKRVRHNYYQTLLELFIARWARPYYEYCAQRGLEFTGHYWEHEWPRPKQVPDNMALAAWQQRPGIDTLMNEYSEDVHAQFGNVRAVKEVASVARQLGPRRTLCEIYGAAGWDLRFVDMKRIGDWLTVLGIDTLNQHLSYVSIRGMRKRDHPPSFSYHAPWWDAYGASARYFARLSAALTQGEAVADALVLEPTTTAWMYQGGTGAEPDLEAVGQAFQQFVTGLERAQVEFDLGCEDVLARHARVDGARLVAGRRPYTTVVLPPRMENINAPTARLLDDFLAAGGRVLCVGPPPERVDGRAGDWGTQAARRAGWQSVGVAEAAATLSQVASDGFAVLSTGDPEALLFHQRRRLADGELLFLVNTSLDRTAAGTVSARLGGVERWDADTGEAEAYPFETTNAGVQAGFELPPAGSLLLLLTRDPRPAVRAPVERERTIEPDGPPRIRRLAPNVLVLDFVDIRAGGESRAAAYVLRAAEFAFQQSGLGRNPWDAAVQFRDEIIRRRCPEDSGFEATYRFTIAGRVPGGLTLVLERPDRYTVTCNGQPVQAEPGAWWLDRAFGRIDLAAAAKLGTNEVTVRAQPTTVFHELESAYLLGDFGLEPGERGFVVVPAAPLAPGPWNRQGHPFYGAGVAYAETFAVAAPRGKYRVALQEWNGSVAQVTVNGRPAGYVTCPPWERDVTPLVRAGTNEIEVTVIGTLRNTLGPHHGRPPVGRAWPPMFAAAPEPGPPPGEQYSTLAYGLFAPFVLREIGG